MMEAYLQTFVNFEQNNWAWLFHMAELPYINAKKTSPSHTSFELNYKYHSCISYNKYLNPHSKSKIA